MGLQYLAFLIVNLLWLTKASAVGAPLARNGCQERCGNILVPFPFGIGSNCSENEWFSLHCNTTTTTTSSPKLFLKSLGLEVLNISFDDGGVFVNYPVLYSNNCSGRKNTVLSSILEGSPFFISADYNIFAAVGCNKRAIITQNRSTFWGCDSICDATTGSVHSCNGTNCCTAAIPRSDNAQVFNITWGSINEADDKGQGQAGCTGAFLVEQNYWEKHNLANSNLFAVNSVEYFPVVLYWYHNFTNQYPEIFDQYHNFTNQYPEIPIHYKFSRPGFPSSRFYCTYYSGGFGMRDCRCEFGYEGNPYLAYGCEDIDECEDPNKNPCGKHCVNLPGSFRCDNKYKMIIIGVCSGVGSLMLLVGAWWLYIIIKKRNIMKCKKKFFKRNGGLLLLQQLSATNDGVEKTKVFNSMELETATDNYNENRILGQGGQGTVYKGMLTDGRIVAIKKSKIVDEANIEQFINEVVIVSQINHRNVVKLLGCCLETEVPLLVYEFVSNGTLFQHIHDPNEDFPLSWAIRLRIVTEIARALFYLHSAASIPIYHRDIKSTNILLDHKYTAKVSDFGTSRLVSIDQTHLTTIVQGTFGYLDPEYFRSSQFTDKSDVYSFGVVMVELLTGEKPISLTRSEACRSLTAYFIQSMEEDRLLEILDPRVVKEGNKEELTGVANLAQRCLHLNGRKRPTMKEVVVELEGIQMSKGGSTIQQNFEEVECITIDFLEASDIISTGPCFDSGKDSSMDVHPLIFNKS